jgi:hypothetical protein
MLARSERFSPLAREMPTTWSGKNFICVIDFLRMVGSEVESEFRREY